MNHDKGSLTGGRLSIESSKLMGLRSERIFTCNLDDPQAQATLSGLTRDVQPRSSEATPLGALVEYVKECRSLAEVRQKCDALLPGAS